MVKAKNSVSLYIYQILFISRSPKKAHLSSQILEHTHTQKDGDGKIYLKKTKYVYIQDIKLTLTYVMCELHIEKVTMPENGIYCVMDEEYQSSRLLCMGNILI